MNKGTSAPRTAEELIAFGDLQFDLYSTEEMNVLFQYLRESWMMQEDYEECEWKELQAHLCRRGVSITVFENWPGLYKTITSEEFSLLFHRLWTKHRVGYRKVAWKVFRQQLLLRGIEV
jgi:hypothetical protein